MENCDDGANGVDAPGGQIAVLRGGVRHRIDKVFEAIGMAVGFLTAAGGQSLPASFCRVQEASSNVAGNKGLGGIERRNRNSALC